MVPIAVLVVAKVVLLMPDCAQVAAARSTWQSRRSHHTRHGPASAVEAMHRSRGTVSVWYI